MDIAAKRVLELERLVRKHQDLYYNGQPEIEDAEFDALWDELSSLDPENPVLRKVGTDSLDGFPKSAHLMPMGSQDKAQDPESFLKWCAKVSHPEYIVQHKLDGASLELQYSEGRYVKAVTRGDGLVGDEITKNAAKMEGCLPLIDPLFSGAVRGEVIMTHEVHDRYFPDKANCRNAANGLMKRKDGEGSERLKIVCYDAVHLRDPGFFVDECAKLEWLKARGFPVVRYEIFSNPRDIVDYRSRTMDGRALLPYDIDGLVVKGRAIDLDDMKRARPEKQIAFKFSPEEAISTLKAVEWSESGSLYTPIGILDPVQLAGTTVQRANLCNPNILRELKLKIGSRVIITKRGEIIPKIEGLVESPEGSADIVFPEACSSCGTRLVDEGTRLLCPNPVCPGKAFHRLEKWISVLGVKDFGGVILRKLFDAGRVRSIPDLYSLRPEDLIAFDRMGETLAKKILKNLESVSELPFASFIAGFDIEGIGELIAERFVQAGYDTIEKLEGAGLAGLSSVNGLGEITARTVIEGVRAAKPEMERLLATGKIRIASPAKGSLKDLSFCFTGELASMKRSEAEALVKARGGSTKPSVTKDLSYLITNDPGSGSSKNLKAKEFGVRVIGEEDFLSLLGAAR